MVDTITERDENQREVDKAKLEITKDDFLAKLGPADRENVQKIKSAFEKILKERGLKGAMIVVGGILTKQMPRKDIDIRVIIETETPENQYNDHYEFATDRFRVLAQVTDAIVSTNTGLRITEKLNPAIEEDYQIPSLLKHDGAIKLERDGTIPIEFLNTVNSSINNILGSQKQEFCVLSRV